MTAEDIIKAAFKTLGILAAGETLPAEDADDTLGVLNRLLASWSAEGITLFYRVPESFALVAGDGEYSIGTAGDFATGRPNRIEQAFIRDSVSYDHHLKVRPIAEYWRIGNKTTSTRPTRLFYDPTYPNGTIYLNALPAEVETLYLVSEKPLSSLAALATAVSLPLEYELAIINRLAVTIAPHFGKSIGAELAMADRRSWRAMTGSNIANNMKPARVSMPGRRSGTYNIDSDE